MLSIMPLITNNPGAEIPAASANSSSPARPLYRDRSGARVRGVAKNTKKCHWSGHRCSPCCRGPGSCAGCGHHKTPHTQEHPILPSPSALPSLYRLYWPSHTFLTYSVSLWPATSAHHPATASPHAPSPLADASGATPPAHPGSGVQARLHGDTETVYAADAADELLSTRPPTPRRAGSRFRTDPSRSSTTFITRVRHALTHPARCGGAQDTTHTGAPYPAFTIGLTEPLPALLALSHIPNILCVSLSFPSDSQPGPRRDMVHRPSAAPGPSPGTAASRVRARSEAKP